MHIHCSVQPIRELFLYEVREKVREKNNGDRLRNRESNRESLQDFKIDTLKEEQREITVAGLKNKDCMAILTTGYGKSLPYQMLIPLRRELQIPSADPTNVGKIIVCSPIIALMQNQVDRLNSIPNVKAVYKGRCFLCSIHS